MSTDLLLRTGDNLPVIQRSFSVAGSPVDLTGFTVKFTILSIDGVTQYVNDSVNVTDAKNGTVQYQWSATAAALSPGFYMAQFVATDTSNTLTFPNNRPLSLLVVNASSAEYSYTGNPASRPLDAMRFLMQDTNVDKANFTDAECNYLLTEYGNPYNAAAEALGILAGRYAGVADRTVGPLNVSFSGLSDRLYNAAEQLRTRAERQGVITPQNGNVVTTPMFAIGMHDTTLSDVFAQEGQDLYKDNWGSQP